MRALAATTALLLALPLSAVAKSREVGFLVIDLEGDGLRLSDAYYPVLFDTDADGRPELTSWTAQGQNEAFLWLDLDRNGRVDHGAELIGGAMAIPTDTPHEHAFAVLRAFDQPFLGGNGDGRLSERDRVWSELRLWVDIDHDGESTQAEISEPHDWGLRQISLAFDSGYDLDGGLNLLGRRAQIEVARSSTRGADRQVRIIAVVEVFFDPATGGDPPVPSRDRRLARTPPL